MAETIRRQARRLSTVLTIGLLLGLLVPAAGAGAVDGVPSVRLIRSAPSVTLQSWEGQVTLDLGLYVAAVGGDFRIHARKPSWSRPVVAVQHHDGRAVRRVPLALVDGWTGLADFIEVRITDPSGAPVGDRALTFCPNGWERQRLTDASVRIPTFPQSECLSRFSEMFPFTRGMVWGIDEGWATRVFSPGPNDGATVMLSPGRYEVRARVADAHAELLGIAPEHREVSLRLTVVQGPDPVPDPRPGPGVGRAAAPAGPDAASAGPTPASSGGRPVGGTIAPAGMTGGALLPDLAALPAWGLAIEQQDGRDILGFASTPWNAGPGPFVVEAFRRPDEDVMDAYQYLYDEDGRVRGRVPIGDMTYHAEGGHDHWHFLQFAAFDLLDRESGTVVKSQKQGFCIAPTDPIDLTLPGAAMRPWAADWGSSCGDPRSLWVREVLAAGWGDTYHNTVAGQAFDVTDLPNGDYVVRVRVDPEGRIQQRSTRNDVASRTVTLGGRPGERTVTVATWNGIDG